MKTTLERIYEKLCRAETLTTSEAWALFYATDEEKRKAAFPPLCGSNNVKILGATLDGPLATESYHCHDCGQDFTVESGG